MSRTEKIVLYVNLALLYAAMVFGVYLYVVRPKPAENTLPWPKYTGIISCQKLTAVPIDASESANRCFPTITLIDGTLYRLHWIGEGDKLRSLFEKQATVWGELSAEEPEADFDGVINVFEVQSSGATP